MGREHPVCGSLVSILWGFRLAAHGYSTVQMYPCASECHRRGEVFQGWFFMLFDGRVELLTQSNFVLNLISLQFIFPLISCDFFCCQTIN